MAGFGGVDEERRRAGGGKGRRDLAADMAGLAEPGDDQPSLGVPDEVGGGDKGAPRSDCSAAVIAAIPLPSASSVRRADWTAASAGSVPDDFAISGFGLAMSVSRERGVAPRAPP